MNGQMIKQVVNKLTENEHSVTNPLLQRKNVSIPKQTTSTVPVHYILRMSLCQLTSDQHAF